MFPAVLNEVRSPVPETTTVSKSPPEMVTDSKLPPLIITVLVTLVERLGATSPVAPPTVKASKSAKPAVLKSTLLPSLFMVRVSTFGMFKGRTPEEAISTVVAAGALRANVTESFGATKDVAVGKVNVPEAFVVNSLRLTVVAVTTAAAPNLVSFAKLTVPAMMLVNPAVVTSVKFTVEVLPAVMIVVPMISSVAISIVFATGAKTLTP